MLACVRACVCACVRAYVRACVRARVRACVGACVRSGVPASFPPVQCVDTACGHECACISVDVRPLVYKEAVGSIAHALRFASDCACEQACLTFCLTACAGQVRAMCEEAGDELEVKHYERTTGPVTVEEKPLQGLHDIQV
eukprot:65684-Chlamydomonas_euryale.AAC.1